MARLIKPCADFLASTRRARAALQVENLALRDLLCVYRRSVKRPKLQPANRILWPSGKGLDMIEGCPVRLLLPLA